MYDLTGKNIFFIEKEIPEAESTLLIKLPLNEVVTANLMPFGVYPYLVEIENKANKKTAFGSSKLIVYH